LEKGPTDMAGWNISLPDSEYFDHESPGLQNLINEVAAQKELAIDTETTGLIRWKDLPLYWSLAWGERRVTLNASTLHFFKAVFDDPSKRWILANAKYDAHILANVGILFAGELADTQVMHALLYEERSHRLKDMAIHLLGWRWSDFQDTFGKIGKRQSASDVIKKAEHENFNLLVEYAANDAWGTLNVYRELRQQLQDAHTDSLFRDKPPYIETLWDLYTKVELPFTKVLWRCERNGILIDQQYLQDIAPRALEEIAGLEKQIVKEAGYLLNPNSPLQLRKYFFEEYRAANGATLRPVKMTQGGKSGVRVASVDSDFLAHYANEVPMAGLLLRHRELSKLHGTYVVGLNSVCDTHGRIHTSFNQDIARTGRLSSSDPNLQNIPRPDNDKWKLRGAFIAPPGYKLVVADYEQLEMKLLACASLEPGMISVIKNGWDIHMGNASIIFGIPYDEINEARTIDKGVKSGELPEEALTPRVHECLLARSASKTLGFGLVYGMGHKKMAHALNITPEDALSKIAQFKQAYPAVDSFTREAVEEAEELGYAFTILGRRRNVSQMMSSRKDERLQGERIAVNTPIQGSAADVAKMAMILCDQAQLETRFGARMLLQIHDELVFECPTDAVPAVMEEVREWMEHPFFEDLVVPLKVAMGSGASWLSAK